jgi:PAS domain S-box-containing protein
LLVSSGILRHVIDSLAVGVVVADLDGRFVLFNPAAERILSLGLRDVPLAEWNSVYGCFRPDIVSPFPAEELPLARSLRGEVVDDCEIFLHRNGATPGSWISVSSRPVADDLGHIVGGVVTFHDITARKQQLDRHHLLAKIVEETADAVLVTDREGNIEYVNAAFEHTTGFSRSEVRGENPRILNSGHHPREFHEQLRARLLRGEVFRDTITDRCVWARRRRPGRPIAGVTLTRERQASGDRSNASCRPAARCAAFEAGTSRVQQLVATAVNTLEELLGARKYPHVRLGAARTVAELAIHQHDSTAILLRLDALERCQRERRTRSRR